jgi:uncharacterized repeat protein (TIGR01451 family)
VAVAAVALAQPAGSQLTSLSANMDVAPPPGWLPINRSNPLGLTTVFQGNASVFVAFEGAATSYAAMNHNATTSTGTIDVWLISPLLALEDGSPFSFATRTVDNPQFADRLEVRVSKNGSCSPGIYPAIGDFTTLLLSLNGDLSPDGYPSPWLHLPLEVVDFPPIPSSATGCIAFRYFVTNGGPTGANSEYIGIDSFVFHEDTPELDLSITKDNGATEVVAGGQSEYTLVAANAGPSAAVAAIVSDPLPIGLTCAWTCVPSGAATCTAGPIDGGIGDVVGLPVGETLTYTVTCDVSVDVAADVVNTASILAPANFDDTDSDNDSATDTDVLGACGFANQLVLRNGIVSSPAAYTACSTVTLGESLVIEETASLEVTAGQSVRFRPMTVAAGGVLTVVIDPGLALP